MLNKTHNQSNTLSQRRTGKVRRLYFSAVLMLALCAALACPALAADTDRSYRQCPAVRNPYAHTEPEWYG